MPDRLPALPLIVNDPYFSIWMPADTFTGAVPVHWSGAEKRLLGLAEIDGKRFCWLGKSACPAMETASLRVTPTRTVSELRAAGVALEAAFWSATLPDDLDALSTPITFVDLRARSLDGAAHAVTVRLEVSAALCFDGPTPSPMAGAAYAAGGVNVAYTGQARQRVLGHSGDHVTMDWGYLYMASEGRVSRTAADGLRFKQTLACGPDDAAAAGLLLGYDDVAAINYFGVFCRAWYQRSGRTLPEALLDFHARRDALRAACEALDARVLGEAEALGGADYAFLCAAGWRQAFGAHKLIATPAGEMALISKENDSNGCAATADVSYPSTPIFLKYCPELVNALCRPVLAFSQLPVWEYDFAPHDAGRYPFVTGQVYAAPPLANGLTPPPYYLYPAGTGIYDPRLQMPVEECGNLIIMLEAALSFGADAGLLRRCAPTLERWAGYLLREGEDPGEQLCTDDFAGHLARNVNLAAKAAVGAACFGRLLRRLGRGEEAEAWLARARAMAERWLARARTEAGTALTFDGLGWSMKYNLVWDRVLGLGLLPEAFYRREAESYLPRQNAFGLPLDSRADYTKADWLVWSACLSPENATFRALIAPLARFLRETPTRVPFSDWYDTKTGAYVEFIARSVIGGVYMPMLIKG